MQVSTSSQLPLLELDVLRTLVAIADTGNFSAAAETVYRTPSAVSMQVKKAEALVGRPLFNRDSRSVTLTVDGERLIQHGRRMLTMNREMMAQFMAADVSGIVRLAEPDDMAERALPDLLRRFSQTHCGVTVDVLVESSVNLLKKVRSNELDLAVITCDPENLVPDDVEVLFQEGLTWAGARNGIAHERDPLPVSVWEEGCAWRNAGLQSLQDTKRNFRVAFMSAHISGQRASILADLAVAPIPVSACVNGVVALSETDGLPRLKDYALGMVLAEKLSAPALAAAEHLRDSYCSQEPPLIRSSAG